MKKNTIVHLISLQEKYWVMNPSFVSKDERLVLEQIIQELGITSNSVYVTEQDTAVTLVSY